MSKKSKKLLIDDLAEEIGSDDSQMDDDEEGESEMDDEEGESEMDDEEGSESELVSIEMNEKDMKKALKTAKKLARQ